jgi:hypothetical protein
MAPEGDPDAPAPGGAKDATVIRNAHVKNDDRARYYIISAIDDELISIVRSLTSAKDTWDALAARFNDKSISSVIRARRKYITCTITATDGMASHIAKLKNMYDKLYDIGGKVDEADHVLVLLSSLPDTYNNVVVALETGRKLEDLKYAYITTTLLHEEQRRLEQGLSRTGSSGTAALYAADAKTGFTKNNDSNTGGQRGRQQRTGRGGGGGRHGRSASAPRSTSSASRAARSTRLLPHAPRGRRVAHDRRALRLTTRLSRPSAAASSTRSARGLSASLTSPTTSSTSSSASRSSATVTSA